MQPFAHREAAHQRPSASALLDYEKGEAKKRQGKRTDLDSTSAPKEAEVGKHPVRATAKAAARMGTSRSSVERAARVAKKRPDLHEKVKAGEMSVGGAFEQMSAIV